MSAEQPTRRGRPLEERPRLAAIEATLELMAERGARGVTTDAVAARARTSKASIYRRWRSKDALIADAIAGLVTGHIPVPDRGSLAEDVRALLDDAVRLYSAPRARRLMPELVSEMARNPELAERVRAGFLERRRSALRVVLERARERGELRADVDLELCLDLLGGVVFYRLLITGGPLDERLPDQLTDALLHGIADPKQ